MRDEPVLTQNEIDAIAQRVAAVMTDKRHRQWIDPETHYQHHRLMQKLADNAEANDEVMAYVREKMETERMKRERLERIRDRATGGVLVGFILSLLGYIGNHAVQWMQKLLER